MDFKKREDLVELYCFELIFKIQKTCLEFIDSVIFLISHQSLKTRSKKVQVLQSLPIHINAAADCLK